MCLHQHSANNRNQTEMFFVTKNHFAYIPEKWKTPEIFKYKLFKGESYIMCFMNFYETSEVLVRIMK